MAEHDFFADIALTQHPIQNNDKEIPPREQTDKVFEESGEGFPYGKLRLPQDETQEQRLLRFQKELKELREYYLPFMENRMQPVQEVVKQELKHFEFRYQKPHEIFTTRNDSGEQWEQVTIPDYRGPAGSDGKWKAYYRTEFLAGDITKGMHGILRFQCVDYKALIYVNGNFVGQHEGFFAPFEIDVTDYLAEKNELVIEVHNDIPTKGDESPILDGDKIYAATGPGWDDPQVGWHHCPAGAGVFGKVTFEERPTIFIDDIFVRPNIDDHTAELRMGVMNYEDSLPEDFTLTVQIAPRNFEGSLQEPYTADIKVVGRGKNEYRYSIPMVDYKLWSPDTPYLYGIVCTITKEDCVVTESVKHFGMRKFVSDESTEPKGKFFLNNQPIILRGANEMGHLQQCVMQGDMEQLVDDILIGKLCHMNYYRITQRPVQEEIYDYMDMLGMMNQSDLPLFSTLRRNQACEAVKQSTEMEHLLRSHPSAVMVSFINEPVCIRRTEDPNSKFSRRYDLKGHRHLYRDELEAFFVAARKMIYIENPDRVIKNVEGDYDPPTAEGMPDFHTYTMWYTNHPLTIGKLARGYIPPVKQGWMIGCGEYGAEGLDHENIMLERYPKEWLNKDAQGNWYPTGIVRSQMNAMHGDWFAEQNTMSDWIRESQIHQENATKMMTEAFRRRSDYIGHTAIHLLIDAWPSGWMKTLVGCDRIPKKAYYAYQDALVPYRVNLRCDRKYVYAGEKIMAEAWLLNDTSEARNGKIVASVSINGKIRKSYTIDSSVDAAYSICAGRIPMEVPAVTEETILALDAAVLDADGTPIHGERMEFYVYPSCQSWHKDNEQIAVLGKMAEQMADCYGYQTSKEASKLLVSELEGNEAFIEEKLEQGGNVVVVLPDVEQTDTRLAGIPIQTKKGPKVFYAAARKDLVDYHFNFLYNQEKDYMDLIARKYILGDEGEELLYTYGKSGKDGVKAPKEHFPLVKKYHVGRGTLYVVSLVMEGKVGQNANLDKFLIDCMEDRIQG